MDDQKKSIDHGVDILKKSDLRSEWQRKRENLLKEKIDVTEFFVNFFENYKDNKKR